MFAYTIVIFTILAFAFNYKKQKKITAPVKVRLFSDF